MRHMKRQDKQPREKRTFWYTFARLLFSFLSQLLFPIKFHNLQYINQQDAPYMLVSNHVSMFDPPALAIAIKRYEIRFLGKRELNVNPILNYFFNKLHMISVSRHATDIAAMRASNEVLKKGQVLGIFPEGTRNKPENFMTDVQSGLSVLVLRNKIPLMPAYIHGRIRFFHLNHVYFLPAIPYEDILEEGLGKDSADKLTQRYVQAITEAKAVAVLELAKKT